MKLEPWEPDLGSLYSRYREGSLDLQPAFQRGLVWPREKKARLIDTVLRGWRVPPVHLVIEDDERLSVLDGQQRLQALFDFVDNEFAISEFPPGDDSITPLVGRHFRQLPEVFQRRIRSTRISAYRLYEYEPDEPYELFFRLNLPTGLTQAEKRNALAGETRRQIRDIVDRAEKFGWSKDLLGFSDGRLAYDDVIARTCAYVARQSIGAPLTSRDMEDLYRHPDGLQEYTATVVHRAVEYFTYEARQISGRTRFNKATLLTWLLVAARAIMSGHGSIPLTAAIEMLEGGRVSVGRGGVYDSLASFSDPIRTSPLVALYVDRASLRVADVLSVQARDAVAWLAVSENNDASLLPPVVRELQSKVDRLRYLGTEAFESGVLGLVSAWPKWSELS